jgi:hypothetical protein
MTEVVRVVVTRADGGGLVASVTPAMAPPEIAVALEWMTAMRLIGELLGELAIDTLVAEHAKDLDEL